MILSFDDVSTLQWNVTGNKLQINKEEKMKYRKKSWNMSGSVNINFRNMITLNIFRMYVHTYPLIGV